ncbi:MAG: DUF971 domain-containing protein [Bryobacterales bacterium]|nr:DUF971 domain-containing protein [Bryobacterales bacterium]
MSETRQSPAEQRGADLFPEHFAVSKSTGIKIDWSDGERSDFSLEFLRERCPCAQCTGAHGTPPQALDFSNPLQLYRERLKITQVEPIGHYAIGIHWNDGHKTGIYSYRLLRELHEELARKHRSSALQ